MDKSIQLAQLWLSLHNIQATINAEILPLMAHLGADKDESGAELFNDLTIAAESVNTYLAKFRLQAEAVKK
jgi:hypothetical protein